MNGFVATCASTAMLSVLVVLPLRAQVPGELRGRVSDAQTARPISGASVEIEGRVVRSTADGTFIVRGVEPREYHIRIRAVGFAVADRDVEVTNGRATVIDVSLDRLPEALRPVVSRAQRDESGSGVATFDRRAIETSGRRDIGELLQSSPGVVVTQAGGPGSASHISIRGSSANEVLVLVDGVPINSQISGEADLSRISLEAVEQVIVRQGAQSARFGGRALAGVVEITTRRSAQESSAVARQGAWGEHQIAATIGAGRSLWGARATGSIAGDYRSVDGDFPYDVPALRGGGTTHRINSDVTSRQVSGTGAIEGTESVLRGRISWNDVSRGLAGSIVQPSSTGREQNSRASGGVELSTNAFGIAWVAAGDLTRERATFSDPSPSFGTAYDDRVNVTGGTITLSGAAGRGPISGAAGAEARTIRVSSSMLSADAPRRQRLLGAWANARAAWELARTGATLEAEAGARIDESSLIGNAVASPRARVSLTRAGVVASLALANGYAPPSLADQFFHEGVLVRPKPAIRPERTTGDLEARVAVRDQRIGPVMWRAEAAAFRANVDGMILWFPDFRFIWSPSNVSVRRRGWELSGRAALPRGAFDVQGTLNRVEVEYAESVLRGQVVYRPRTTASVTTGGRVSRFGRLELTTRYVSSRRTVSGSDANSLDPYWISDLRWTRTFARARWSFDVGAGADNLFDRPAAMLVDYPFPGRSWSLSLRVHRSSIN